VGDVAGRSLRTMERSLGVSLPRIQRFLRQSGGVRPLPQRRRDGHLVAGEREEISRGIAAGLSGRVIAGRLGRSPSTVSREIDRNGGRDAYREPGVDADATAYDRARRPNPSKLVNNNGTEAMNGLIELHRRIARGFRNRHNYRLRMLLIEGGLTHPDLA